MKFDDWITQKFIEWRGNTMRNVSDFANYLYVPQPALSSWMTGKYKPKSARHIQSIGQKYPEIYELLDIPNPHGKSPLDSIPSDMRERIELATAEIEDEFKRRGITGEMPEAVKIATEIMEKHGFKYIRTDTSPD